VTKAHPSSAHRRATAPRVTAVIPTYNRSSFLREAIQSVIAQTFTEFVLVVSDNCSTDDTAAVVTSFHDERLRYLQQPVHLDLNEHFSRCLHLADTDYLFLLPDDDLMHPNLLARSVEALDRHPEAGMVHASARVVDADGAVIAAAHNMTRTLWEDTLEPGEAYVREAMKGGYRVNGSTVLFRTEAIRSRGLRYEQGDYPATDFALVLRLALDWDIAFIAEPLADYRVHGTTYTSQAGADANQGGYVQGLEMILKIRDVKLRFLAEHGARFPDAGDLRRQARQAMRSELIERAGRLTLPRRRPGDTIRRLAEAAGVDRGVAIDPAAWRLLAGAFAGARLRQSVRSWRAHITTEPS
jgi:glycosyltransferase involved in cell wall biosynthesis